VVIAWSEFLRKAQDRLFDCAAHLREPLRSG